MYADDLLGHRRQKDQFFKTSPHSPLTQEQQDAFQGLPYFPPDESYLLTVDAERLDGGAIAIETTRGEVRQYRRYARFTVNAPDADGEHMPIALTIYETQHGFFLPFTDSADGVYSGGRYLEPDLIDETPDRARFSVDFNMAYSPFCAFSDGWSCPIVPGENRLSVPIRAGERYLEAY
ncbi:MAG: DUF1684 domain-containing protein [Chloroflexota bacterium]|nr:DUF1684 domain-containing protein [Chloroflexota bacterium]